MKQFIYILSLIISVIFTSCEGLPNGGMDINEMNGEEVKMVAMATRGLIDENKSIGAFMYKDGNIFNSTSNFKYNFAREITPENENESRYELDAAETDKVLRYPSTGIGTIYAYYPYVDSQEMPSISNLIYNINDWNQQYGNEVKYDLFVATTEGSTADKGVKKTLDFYHAFSRIEFNIKMSPNCIMEESELEGLKLSVTNVNKPISYNIVNGAFTYNIPNGFDTTLKMKVSTTDDGLTAYAVVPPEAENQDCYIRIELTDGKTFGCKIPNKTRLLPNQKYVWNVFVEYNYIYVIAELDDEIPYGGVF